MATLTHANSKRMYSWWWDSHISPKNSRWLQENLTDMDVKVKQMIKLLEEDADSFARRAEMYYKKRPELMKLVEEFYRAYRALAERYDNATGVLRQAHKTMAEAFPNHMMIADEPPPEFDPQTPDQAFPNRNGGFSGDSDSITGRKSLRQFNGGLSGPGEGRVRRGLNFHDSEEKQGHQSEEEIANLKKVLVRLEAEKDAGILQYQQALEESKKFSDRAEQAEAEVRSLKDSIARLEEEKNVSLLKYQECLDKIGSMENLLKESNERADRVQDEAEALKEDLVKVEAEKEASLGKYYESLKVISGLEENLRNSQAEVEGLKEELGKLRETILELEQKLALAEEETQRLRLEIDDRTEKLRISEERSQMLESSNQTLHSQVKTQSRELAEKQTEVGNLWASVQEERARFVEAETAFQTLQHLHSQSQEELRSLAVEIQARNQILKDMEGHNQILQGEVDRMLDENKNLNEVNLSSSLAVKNLQEETLSLREMIQKLEQEIDLRVDERNALQQEIYCLKEELNGLNEKNRNLEEHVDSERSEKALLLEKLAVMEKLIEKNLLLENSLSDLNVELEGLREKVKALELSCESLLGEKDVLTSQLNMLTKNFEKLEEKNTLLENSLCDANAEVEALRAKSKSLEDSCSLLGEEKLGLVGERENLVMQLDESHNRLKDLEKRFQELEEIHAFVVKEKASIVLEMAELNKTWSTEREEHSGFVRSSEAQIRDMESQIIILQQEAASTNSKYEEELDKNLSSQTEIFVLRNCMNELKDKFLSLSLDCQRLAEMSDLSGQQISCLESKNLQQQVELKGLTNEFNELNMWLYDVFGFLNIDAEHGVQHNDKIDWEAVELIIWKVKELQTEIFILQKCMKESEEKISSLSLNCQMLVEGSHDAEKKISLLTGKNLEQQVALKALSDHIHELRFGLCEVLRAFGIGAEYSFEHKADAVRETVESITGNVKGLQNSLAKVEEDELLGTIEKSVLATILRQTEAQAAGLSAEKHELHHNLGLQREKLVLLQKEFACVTGNVKGLQNSLAKVEEDELLGTLEKSVLATILRQTEAEAAGLSAAKDELHQNLGLQTEKLVLLQKELEMIVKTSEELRSKVVEGICREEVMKSEMTILHERLTCTRAAFEQLQVENSAVIEEKRGLEEESHLVLGEKLSHATNSAILEDVVRQNFATLKELVRELEKVHSVNGSLTDKVIFLEGNLGNVRTEKLELEGLLWKSQNEVESVYSVKEELSSELVTLKDTVKQLEKKLGEATETRTLTENKKQEMERELEGKLEATRAEKIELEGLLEKSGNEVKTLTSVNEQLNSDLVAKTEMVEQLETKLFEATAAINAVVDKKREIEEEMESKLETAQAEKLVLVGLLEKSENKVKSATSVNEQLNSEFSSVKARVEQLEKNLFDAEGMISAMEQKKSELEKELECAQADKLELEGLLAMSETEVKSVSASNEKLNCEITDNNERMGQLEKQLDEAAETINVIGNQKLELEKELKDLKEEYGSAYSKLMVSEVREILFEEKIHQTAEELEATRESGRIEKETLEKNVVSLEGEKEELNAKLVAYSSAFVSLRDCVVSLESSINLEKQNNSDDLEHEDLKSMHDLERRLRAIEMSVTKLGKMKGPNSSPTPDTAAAEGRLMTKDIMLDQVSECSSYGVIQREILKCDDDQVLELWDAGRDAKHGKRKIKDSRGYEERKEHRNLNPSADSLVDKLEFSESMSDIQSTGSKRRVKVLERLDSDVQKLTNLQITLEDLKRKVETIEKKKNKGEIRKVKEFEYETVKAQLEEADSAIAKLFNTNRKLAKNLEEEPEDNDVPGVSRRRISEQARRGSEKIGRIQLELQRIQFMLLKIEDGNESMGWSKRVADERSKRVLLRDYLYGGSMRGHKNDPRRKKATTFCACAPKVVD